MVNLPYNAPAAEIANYKPQRIPHYIGNPLIEALPDTLTDEELDIALTSLPEFNLLQRAWRGEERIQMILKLSNYMAPLDRHKRLARAFDSMLRSGYEDRRVRTVTYAARLQKTQSPSGATKQVPTSFLDNDFQLSSLLIGVSGMGKTSTLKRICSCYPQVIYHPEHSIYQVTYLHIQLPSDGSSVRTLALAILNKLDRLIPGANYYKDFAKVRQSEDALLEDVSRILDNHHVGVLIVDEVQNLTNANTGKNKQTLVAQLVNMCNDKGVPILFVGTNKASRVFSMDGSKGRRGSGHGFPDWDRFEEASIPDINSSSDGRPAKGEWQEFLQTLWTYQWAREPVALDASFSATMYHLSQGIVDIAIKLFAAAQVEAIFNKTERLSTDLLYLVYDTQMSLLHDMMDALREGDPTALEKYPDIAPFNIQSMVDLAAKKVRAASSKAYAVKPTDNEFVPRIAASLVAGGYDEDTAIQAAEYVLEEGKCTNLDEGVERARKYLKTLKPSTPTKKRQSSKTSEAEPSAPDFAPEDYRRAISLAAKEKTTVYEQLQILGMAKPLGELLNFQ